MQGLYLFSFFVLTCLQRHDGMTIHFFVASRSLGGSLRSGTLCLEIGETPLPLCILVS